MRIIYIASIAFDANLSLIRELKKYHDISFVFELKTHEPNRLDIVRDLGGDIIRGDNLEELVKWRKFLPLEQTYVVNSVSFKKVFSLIRKQIKVYKLIKSINADLIHCGNELHPVFFLFLLLSRKKVILTVHDPIHHSGEQGLVNKFIRKISFFAAKQIVLLNSKQKEEFINRYSFNEKAVCVSSLGVYDFLTNYKNTLPKRFLRNPYKLKVLFFGRISPYKGVKILLDAFIELDKDDTCLTIAGAGSYNFDQKKYESNPNITFIHRFLSTQELVNEISVADIVVCPYIDATQSGVVMSSFALNTPVIVTNVGGLPEMVENGVTGLVVPSSDVRSLSLALDQIYTNPQILSSMKMNIEKIYGEGDKSWKSIALGLNDIYENNR